MGRGVGRHGQEEGEQRRDRAPTRWRILGYDLAAFFERTSARFKAEVEAVLKSLLEAK
jgi:hypothetical protein